MVGGDKWCAERNATYTEMQAERPNSLGRQVAKLAAIVLAYNLAGSRADRLNG